MKHAGFEKKICATCFKQKLQIFNLCPTVFFGLLGLSTFHGIFPICLHKKEVKSD